MFLQFTLSKVVPAASVLVHVPHEDELDAVLVGAGAAHVKFLMLFGKFTLL